MQITIISGSHSVDSQSARVADYLRSRLLDLPLGCDVQVGLHDLGAEPLALWQPGIPGLNPQQANMCRSADAYILISPDWHGMATPALKNWFYFLEQAWMEHKPVLLVGVSSGQGGLYPIMDLRAFAFKNFRPCYLPEHLVIRDVRQQLPFEGDIAQPLGERIDYCLQLLAVYAAGLTQVRAQLPERSAAFAFGM